MRLVRADQLAFELAEVALAWSRGPDDAGALSLRQVERKPGYLDVEIATIRPVPPIASMLFSEAVHHLRSAIDNVVFYMAAQRRKEPLTPEQARAVGMLIYEQSEKFEGKVNRLVRRQGSLSSTPPPRWGSASPRCSPITTRHETDAFQALASYPTRP